MAMINMNYYRTNQLKFFCMFLFDALSLHINISMKILTEYSKHQFPCIKVMIKRPCLFDNSWEFIAQSVRNINIVHEQKSYIFISCDMYDMSNFL